MVYAKFSLTEEEKQNIVTDTGTRVGFLAVFKSPKMNTKETMIKR